MDLELQRVSVRQLPHTLDELDLVKSRKVGLELRLHVSERLRQWREPVPLLREPRLFRPYSTRPSLGWKTKKPSCARARSTYKKP